MKRRTHTRAMHNRVRQVEQGQISWSYVLITLFCAAIVAVGFFFAALQHFATIDLSFKNSKLRKQVDDLNSEKRRLLLAKEVALSPAELTKTAKSLGFREVDRELEAVSETVAVNTPKSVAATATDTKVEQVVDTKPTATSVKGQTKDKQADAADAAKLTKTVMTAPVRERNAAAAKNVAPKQENSLQGGESRARRVNEPIAKNEKPNTVRSTKLR